MRPIFVVFVFACIAAPAVAQVDAPTVPPAAQIEAPLPAPVAEVEAPLAAVETMDCPQMQAEMMTAGQRMNQQMDPNLGADIQAMQEDSQRQMNQARTAAVGSGLLCAVPGLGMACAATMQAQAVRQSAQAEENRARMDAITGTVQDSMAGIDQDRMMAISERWESQGCEMAQ